MYYTDSMTEALDLRNGLKRFALHLLIPFGFRPSVRGLFYSLLVLGRYFIQSTYYRSLYSS